MQQGFGAGIPRPFYRFVLKPADAAICRNVWSAFQQFFAAGIKGRVDGVQLFKPAAVLGPFGGFQLAHIFAVFFHRHLIEPVVGFAGLPFAFFPEGAEIGFQLPVYADMVHGIVACVGHAVDLADAQTPRQVAKRPWSSV